MEARTEDPFDIDELFQYTMKKEWQEVLRAYERYPSAHKAKLTKSEETALHIAISSYHADQEDARKLEKWVGKLVDTIPGGQAVEILGMPNDNGNTPLHFAAALGSKDICQCIAMKDHKLLEKRNHLSETPFFLAAKYGKLEAFLCLREVWKKGQKEPTEEELDESLVRRNDGCNILHAAISGEYFKLADHIILKHKNLVDRKNVEGSSPLHILAMKPSIFQSSSNLRLCDRIIYKCLIVRKLKEKDLDFESNKNNFCLRDNKKCPDNYETCVKSWSMFKSIVVSMGSRNDKHHGKDEESQEEDNYEGSFPPNYATCVNLFKFAIHLMLIVLGIGFSRIKKIREKKEKHRWAEQIMDKLMKHEESYKYGHNGQSPAENLEPKYAAIFAPPDIPFESDEQGNPYVEENNKSKKNEESDEDKPVEEDRCVIVSAKMKESQTKERLHPVLPDAIQELVPQQSFVLLRYQKRKTPNIKKETPILVAAKMGITEMVDKILDTFPVAIQDVDEHEKNALLLAIENRQTKVFDLLMKKKPPEFVLYQVDDEGNGPLHLAATFHQQHRPWRIPGAALQMQWEI